METKETSLRTEIQESVLNDSEYYKYIFKKTEKISCAVFYILRSDTSISHNDVVITDLENASRALTDISLESLRSTRLNIRESAMELNYALLRLESKLRIAHSARYVSTELLEVFLHEADSVHRSLRKYIEGSTVNPLTASEFMKRETIRERRPVRARLGEGGGAPEGVEAPAGPGRRERILGVIRDKGEASIKDIVEVVTDCSEKTIQRELNSLIQDSIVHREGERRWSKYKLV